MTWMWWLHGPPSHVCKTSKDVHRVSEIAGNAEKSCQTIASRIHWCPVPFGRAADENESLTQMAQTFYHKFNQRNIWVTRVQSRSPKSFCACSRSRAAPALSA